MRNKEIWKDVVGYEDYYEVSNLGNVRGKDRKVIRRHTRPYTITGMRKMKLNFDRYGYYVINLRKNGSCKTFKVHRLVAMAFIKNKENKPQVNHKDGVKNNNKLKNLEWVTRSENSQHSLVTGLSKTKLSFETVKKLKNFYERGMKTKLLSKMLGVSDKQINKILIGKSWSYVK